MGVRQKVDECKKLCSLSHLSVLISNVPGSHPSVDETRIGALKMAKDDRCSVLKNRKTLVV